jgi:hypothetical protein
MPRFKLKCGNSSTALGGSIIRIKVLRNILQQSFGIRFGRLNTLGISRVLTLNNGFIGLLLRRCKLFRHIRDHEHHEIGFFGAISMIIIVSEASWRFVEPWNSYQTLREPSFLSKRIKSKRNQGDILTLLKQLPIFSLTHVCLKRTIFFKIQQYEYKNRG